MFAVFGMRLWRKLNKQSVAQSDVRKLAPKQRMCLFCGQRSEKLDECVVPRECGVLPYAVKEHPGTGCVLIGAEQWHEIEVARPCEVRMLQHRCDQSRIVFEERLHDLNEPGGPILFGALLESGKFTIQREDRTRDC